MKPGRWAVPVAAVGILLLGHHAADAQIMSVDFGHEFLKVALMRQNAPLEIVLNTHSKRKTPTAISFMEATRTFGDDALGHQGKAPDKVPMFFHSTVGKNYTAEDVQSGGRWWADFGLGSRFYSHSIGYDADRGVPTFKVSTEDIYGEEVLAHIFYFAKKMADESVEGEKDINVKEVAVTLPADATQRQRQAIVAAGAIAGLRVTTLVHETSAFAVHRAVDYSPEQGKVEHALYLNMGSRKTEAAVVRLEARTAGMVAGKTAPVVTMLGSALDYRIGGHLMDLRIAEVMLKRFQEKFPKLADGVKTNARALRKLLSQSQKTKSVLSSNKQAGFVVESLFEDTDFQTQITRLEFEEMCKDMFAMLTDPISKALEEAKVTLKDIQHIEVVGGAWRVPKVQQILSEYIEKEKGEKMHIGQHLNGEEAAALGTALIAANASSSFRVRKIFFSDRSKHEYAVQIAAPGGEWARNVTVLYPVGSALGGKKKLALELVEDFNVRVFENGVQIAEHQVTGLQDILAAKWKDYNMTAPPKITATVSLDTSGIIEIRTPTARVEEHHWVNVTVPKPKPNVTRPSAAKNGTPAANGTNSSAEAGDAPEDAADPAGGAEAEPEAKDDAADAEGEKADSTPEGDTPQEEEPAAEKDSPAAAEANASAGNESNVTAEPEVEVVQKLKKKNHETKLTVVRKDSAPVPLTVAQIDELKKKLKEQAAHELEVAAIDGIKNELEAAIYGSRDLMERDDIRKVSTDQQREDITKLATDLEEWMFEPGATKADYEAKLASLKGLVEPITERSEGLEARDAVAEVVTDALKDIKKTAATIKKDMPWVNATKVEAAQAKQKEFETWWGKRKDMQKKLPLHEAPAFTAKEVKEELAKVVKEWERLEKTKKPKEKKESKDTKAKDTKKPAEKAAKAKPMPADAAATQKELEQVRAKKQVLVGKEDFDGAEVYKKREVELEAHLRKLEAAPGGSEEKKPEL